MYTLWSIMLVVLGIIMLLKPRLFFDITESWKSHTIQIVSLQHKSGGALCLLVDILGLAVLYGGAAGA